MDDSNRTYAGDEDLRRAEQELVERLPGPLAPFARLAYNYRWSWLPGGPELFTALDPARFELAGLNPVRLLQESSAASLARAAADRKLVARAAELEAQVQEDLGRPPAPTGDPAHPVAFFCAEYGVHASMPIYSGGLGALAGDLLKEASDRAVPLVAVGLMYRKGYFRQRVDASGWQHEYWIDTDPQRLPAALVTGAGGEPLTITVPIFEADVVAQIWRVDVGRVPLFLLDSNVEANDPVERWITGRLYDWDPDTRLAQYALLGSGGVRALRALGIDPAVIHLNEGHATLAPIEFAQAEVRAGGKLHDALELARARTVFTTHTPVPAGNDTYPRDDVESAIGRLAVELGIGESRLIALGRTRPKDRTEPFGVTQAALRLSRSANAVSRRHGKVAREMWAPLYAEATLEEVPIAHVTNGVHVPTWIGVPMRELFDKWLGSDWMTRAADPATFAPVAQIPDAELWAVRNAQRAMLVEFIHRRSVADRVTRGEPREYVLAAADAFRGDVLTIGFARRVATYKRLALLTRDPDWVLKLLGADRPVQVILAGKAHPKDEEAKRVLERLFDLKGASGVGSRVVFLDDYDLASAAILVRGCDVWLNLPRPPLEASGTSGMKSAINGGLQLSVLDGWWEEAYDGENGWALPGDVSNDPEAQDERDSDTLHKLLEEEVVPEFYERDDAGLPSGWLRRVRDSLVSLTPRFSATRMLEDYVRGPYRS